MTRLYWRFFSQAFVLFALFILPQKGFSQSDLNCNGETQNIEFSGTFQDFIVPDDPFLDEITFNIKGGDGGFAAASFETETGLDAAVALVVIVLDVSAW